MEDGGDGGADGEGDGDGGDDGGDDGDSYKIGLKGLLFPFTLLALGTAAAAALGMGEKVTSAMKPLSRNYQ